MDLLTYFLVQNLCFASIFDQYFFTVLLSNIIVLIVEKKNHNLGLLLTAFVSVSLICDLSKTCCLTWSVFDPI